MFTRNSFEKNYSSDLDTISSIQFQLCLFFLETLETDIILSLKTHEKYHVRGPKFKPCERKRDSLIENETIYAFCARCLQKH